MKIIYTNGFGIVERPAPDALCKKISALSEQLSAKEKRKLLTQLKRKYPKISKAPLLLRLVLNDSNGWLQFLKLSLVPERGIESFPFYESYYDLASRLPRAIRSKMLRKIGAMYHDTDKHGLGAASQVAYLPKRVLDAWLRVLLKGDQIIIDQITKGASTIFAYQAYLNSVQDEVFAGQGSKNRIPKAADIVAIARAIQTAMKETGEKKNARVVMFGSLTKGTVHDGSDIDLAQSNLRRPAKLLFGENPSFSNPVEIEGLERRVDKIFRRAGLKLKLYVHEFSPMGARTLEYYLSYLEPVMVEISPTSINLVVFSSSFKKLSYQDLGIDSPGIRYIPKFKTRYQFNPIP